MAKRLTKPQESQSDDQQFTEMELMPTPLPEPPKENLWPKVIDKNLREAIQTYRDAQERKDKTEKELIGIDKQILLVFAIALLGTLFFSFYLIAVDKLNPVSNVLYPIISLILGFMSGYFAGTGRSKGKGF